MIDIVFNYLSNLFTSDWSTFTIDGTFSNNDNVQALTILTSLDKIHAGNVVHELRST